VLGFLPAFVRAARRNAAQLSALAHFGIPLVGIDPAMTLVYRQEYRKIPGLGDMPEVRLSQEWLLDAMRARQPGQCVPAAFRLLPHCTERTNAAAASAQWKDVFDAAGLSVTMPASGCCGMSGTYGHEARNRDTSAKIFAQSWARHVGSLARTADDGSETELLATGYSCRCQVERMTGRRLRHPVEALLDAV
jgi:Fe-S oxidoreductase